MLRPAARLALAELAALIRRQRERAADSAVDEILRNVIIETRFADHLKAEGPEGIERLENIDQLISVAAETVADEGGELGRTPLERFLQHASLSTDFDRQNPDRDAVTMMTLHPATGLEFQAVLLPGLEEGLFPLRRTHDMPEELEEERRLFYVGITRAMQKLYLSHARSRRRNGETLQSIPSSFLAPIPPALLTQRASFRLRGSTRAVPMQSAASRRPGRNVDRSFADSEVEASQDAPRLVKGERVRHARFGSGTVRELTGVARDMKVTVDFDDEAIGTKRLVVQYAGLERGFE